MNTNTTERRPADPALLPAAPYLPRMAMALRFCYWSHLPGKLRAAAITRGHTPGAVMPYAAVAEVLAFDGFRVTADDAPRLVVAAYDAIAAVERAGVEA